MTKPRVLDELAYAGPGHLDTGFVAGFDRAQGRHDPGEDLAALAGHGPGPEATVVESAQGRAGSPVPVPCGPRGDG